MIWDQQSTVLARFAKPRTKSATTLAILSDPHLTETRNGTWKLYHRTVERFKTALAEATSSSVDAIIFPGDMSGAGKRNELETVDRCLSAVSVPYMAVPGNHDVKNTACENVIEASEKFAERYSNGEIPFIRTVRGVDLIGLNSNALVDELSEDKVPGHVSECQLNWLRKTLKTATTPVTILHHPITRSWGEETAFNPTAFRLDNAKELIACLNRYDARLVISGHVHWPLVGTAGKVREIVCPATCSFPQSFLLIEIGPDGTTVTLNVLPGRNIQRVAYQHLVRDAPLEGVYRRTADSDYLDRFPLINEIG